jgi:UDP-glucose 4-epimerase
VVLDRYTVLDVQQKDDFKKLDTSADFIFYFAGITGIANGFDNYERFIDINETGLLHLLERIKTDKSRSHIVFPSTRLIYKGVHNTPLDENAEKECRTIYALNKWFGEQVIDQHAKYFGIPYTIFRICVPYGNMLDDKYSYGTIGFFLSKARKKEAITLFGKGEPQRTFTHIEDICIQISDTLKHPAALNNTYNIMGEQFSLEEVAGKIGHRFGVNLEYIDWPPMDALMESGDTIFNSQKVFNLLKKPLKHNFHNWLETLN